jgi:hypothetical protein
MVHGFLSFVLVECLLLVIPKGNPLLALPLLVSLRFRFHFSFVIPEGNLRSLRPAENLALAETLL